MEKFVHLHVHSVYSFLDGYNKIDTLVSRVKELGQPAIALTDHNELGGIPSFLEECNKQGIKPLLGLEGYYTPSIEELSKSAEERREDAIQAALEAEVITQELIDKVKAKKVPKKNLDELIEPYKYNTKAYHILYIAKNQNGWHNLVKLQSESARLCTFNGRHHADMELIRKYHEDLICTCACIGSYPSQMIMQNNVEEAEKYLDEMVDIFGDDFYLEIQPLNVIEQNITNLVYMNYAKKNKVKCVATNDAHWTYKEDWDDHDTLLCIGIGKNKDDEDRLRYAPDFWIKSLKEMNESFENQTNAIKELSVSNDEIKEYETFYKKALENTVEVANKVETGIKLGADTPQFSKVKIPGDLSPEAFLTMLAWKSLYEYLAKNPELDRELYSNRLFEELDIINSKGYAPYFIAVREYVQWANDHDCPTGPGRGSAAGSLALFCIGVTKNIDPIQNNLWFSRFLTKDRTSPPDWK